MDFLELPVARSGHDFLQVHIDLLPGRVWLVPTFMTATPETAARKHVGSVFTDVGLPDGLVSDRDTRSTSAFRVWTALHATQGACLIFCSPHHHNTTSKVEGVIADVLRAFAGERGDDWPEFVPLAGFAVNDSASQLGWAPAGSGEAAAHLMARVRAEVLALQQERQDRRKAELDALRRDVQFALGVEVLLDTEHTPLPSLSLLSLGCRGLVVMATG